MPSDEAAQINAVETPAQIQENASRPPGRFVRFRKYGAPALLTVILCGAVAMAIQFTAGNNPPVPAAPQRTLSTSESVKFASRLHSEGLTHFAAGRFREAAVDFQISRIVLFEAEYTNSRIFLSALLGGSAAAIRLKEPEEAAGLLDQLRIALRSLGMSYDILQADCDANLAILAVMRGDFAEYERHRERAADLYGRLGVDSGFSSEWNETASAPRVGRDVPAPDIAEGSDLTPEEKNRLMSFTSAYNFYRHSMDIRNRTYQGRHEDTNILIRSLLDQQKQVSQPLNILRRNFFAPVGHERGREMFFIDIGPALGNLSMPAITTEAVAQEFSEMIVVALDLPEAVERFQYAWPAARNRLLSNGNFYILRGDGRLGLKEQAAKSENWILTDRKPPAILSGQPVVIRLANSIDIYESWDVIEPMIRKICLDFKDNPLLFIFNRSILFKQEKSVRIKIIGYVSARGFHHNEESFDRMGEEPYTLSPSALMRPESETEAKQVY